MTFYRAVNAIILLPLLPVLPTSVFGELCIEVYSLSFVLLVYSV